MDFGIAGLRALVCGASKGLGYGCALALAREGVDVVVCARGREGIERAAQAIDAACGRPGAATPLALDITSADGRAQALAAGRPHYDIVVTNAGGPPPGDFRQFTRDDWIAALDANMLTPLELIRASVDGMMARGFGRIVNITSGSVKAPIDILPLSNGARSGLTGVVAGIARKTVARGVTINNLLPGQFDTDRIRVTLERGAAAAGVDAARFRAERERAIPAGRFGTVEEFGAFCAFLCSRQAGYLTGQNILLDGGAYPGTF
jgi:3-oxoacyl-[acyl-carrier protein] reductase